MSIIKVQRRSVEGPLLLSGLFRRAKRQLERITASPAFETELFEFGGNIMATTNLIRQEITIVNQLGLHARPAAEFVRVTKAFRSQVWLVKEGERFSAASILDVLTANLNRGDTATIEADGPDAEEAVSRLAELIRQFESADSEGEQNGSCRADDDF